MTSKFTREQLIKKAQEQIAFCRHTKITGEGLAHVNQCAALFEIALAAMDSEPVAWTWHYREQWHVTNDERRAEFVAKDGDVAVLPLYRHAQSAQISEPVLPLQDKDLQGVIDALEHPAGINAAGKQVVRHALVEIQERRKADREPVAEVVSIYGDPEAFGEREIRPLVGIQQMPYGTKLYRHAQQPVVPKEWAVADAVKFCKETGRQDACAAMDAWKDTAPVIGISLVNIARRTSQLLRQLDYEPNAKSENPIEVLLFDAEKVGSDIKEMKKSLAAMLAAAPQSPGSEPATVPGTWIPVSERMPPSRHEVLVGRWWGENPRWCCKWATYIPGHPDAQSSGWLIPGASWTPTHWMPLPAGPREVKGE